MGRKEIETVICRYKMLPEQGAIVLRDVYSLNSKLSIMQNLPKSINDLIETNDIIQAKQD